MSNFDAKYMNDQGENKNSHRTDMTRISDSNGSASVVVEASGLCKSFDTANGRLDVLTGIDLEVLRGEVVSVVGESGTGKSTMLHILGGLDKFTDGKVSVCGTEYANLNDNELARFRNSNVGFVFQFHHLLVDCTALENVMMPLLVAGKDRRVAEDQAASLLEMIHLGNRSGHRPGELSGGEQQRVAVLRAVANNPAVVLADEPSGNLDMRTAADLHDFIFELADRTKTTFIIATHNRDLAGRADRIFELKSGRAVPIDGGDV